MATKKKPPSIPFTKLIFWQQFFAGLLILIGFLLIIFAVSKNFNFSFFKKIEEPQKQNQIEANKASKIVKISIAKINKVLDVTDGTFDGRRWVVSVNGVSFYTDSKLPEENGNTVLYGHNKAAVLGGLVALKKGDKIDLMLESGKALSYEVFETKTIKPTDVSILNTSTDTILTIYTCSGFLDTSRFVVVAKLVSH